VGAVPDRGLHHLLRCHLYPLDLPALAYVEVLAISAEPVAARCGYAEDLGPRHEVRHGLLLDRVDVAGYDPAVHEEVEGAVDDASDAAEPYLTLTYLAVPRTCGALHPPSLPLGPESGGRTRYLLLLRPGHPPGLKIASQNLRDHQDLCGCRLGLLLMASSPPAASFPTIRQEPLAPRFNCACQKACCCRVRPSLPKPRSVPQGAKPALLPTHPHHGHNDISQA